MAPVVGWKECVSAPAGTMTFTCTRLPPTTCTKSAMMVVVALT